MSFHFEYPADYDSQFHAPEPEGMAGVMGGDSQELVPKPIACNNCGKPIEFLSKIKVPCLQWKHVSGHYGCNEVKLMHSETYAEPAEPSVLPETDRSRAWKQRLANACKEAK
jgi:hypothetical protein